MISLNIERQMKLEALTKYFMEKRGVKSSSQYALEVLDLLDSIDLSTQEAWMAEERMREAEKDAETHIGEKYEEE